MIELIRRNEHQRIPYLQVTGRYMGALPLYQGGAYSWQQFMKTSR
jgi:uroporphyrinogen-III decarboxylase